jgi:hypothetical protein
MEQSTLWVADSFSDSPEIPSPLSETEFSLLISQHPDSCPFPEIDQSIPDRPIYFVSVHFNIIILCTARSAKLPIYVSTPKNASVFPLAYACHIPVHLVPVGLITGTVFGEEYTL